MLGLSWFQQFIGLRYGLYVNARTTPKITTTLRRKTISFAHRVLENVLDSAMAESRWMENSSNLSPTSAIRRCIGEYGIASGCCSIVYSIRPEVVEIPDPGVAFLLVVLVVVVVIFWLAEAMAVETRTYIDELDVRNVH
jgi:hypothetical protein